MLPLALRQAGLKRPRSRPSSFSPFSFFSSSSTSPPSLPHTDGGDDVRLIACVAPPRLAIGKAGQLPWDLPEDRHYFFHCTRGHVLVLGRRSYQELGHALPDRHTVVVSRTLQSLPDARVAHSLEEALVLARRIKEEEGGRGRRMVTWIGGGHDLYADAMKGQWGSLLYLTRTKFEVYDGDTFFPVAWKKYFPQCMSVDPFLSSRCTFEIYTRGAGAGGDKGKGP